jgi:FkbM family methyltransferase
MNSDISYRQCGVENVDGLWWVTKDDGAWDGPLGDWQSDKGAFMSHVTEFDTVIQAGGCCGMYPRFYKNYFKHVYTFEPDPISFSALLMNCAGNEYHKFNCGLSNMTTTGEMYRPHTNNIGMNELRLGVGEIPVLTLDSLDIQKCNLLHLDVEGAEESVIMGARELIEKNNPVVIVERGNGAELLIQMGYTRVHVLPMDHVFAKI